jgi:(S)-mandelate dehydrogenase
MLGNNIYSVAQCRTLARKRLPHFAFDFIDSGAGREFAISENEAALRDLQIVPQMLRGIVRAELGTEVLGERYAAPFGIAPMGVPSVAWPGAEKGLAEAASAADIPFVLSNAACIGIDEATRHAPGKVWFQLYHGHSSEHSNRSVEAALKAGVRVLVLTVDRPIGSWRLRDLINGVGLDYKLDMRALISLAMHPHWSLSTLWAGLPRPIHMGPPLAQTSPVPLNWDFLDALRKRWPHKLLVKGILDAKDATRALSLGADGIVISNHGGAQLESAAATITQLPLIRKAVGPTATLIIDSGFRTGEDIAKAIALGANFVLLGRAFAYSIAAIGPTTGPSRMAALLAEELGRVLPLMGYQDTKSLFESSFNEPIVERRNRA